MKDEKHRQGPEKPSQPAHRRAFLEFKIGVIFTAEGDLWHRPLRATGPSSRASQESTDDRLPLDDASSFKIARHRQPCPTLRGGRRCIMDIRRAKRFTRRILSVKRTAGARC